MIRTSIVRAAGATIALCLLAADPAYAQAAAAQRLNWFWSIFAGFVLAGLGIAIFAWFFDITRLHWIFVVIAWSVVTYLLRYHTAI